jgi:hypothetical protein
MYASTQKIKNNDIEIIRFRDQIARFTFLQFAFGLYDYIIGNFNIMTLLNKIMMSHIGISAFVFFKEYIDKIKLRFK